MREWKFLTNHTLILYMIAQQPRITAREISLIVGITEKTVVNTISDLEAGGYVIKKKVGRRIRYRINHDLPLRSDLHEDKEIGDLLEFLGWEDKRKRKNFSKGNHGFQIKLPVMTGSK